MVKTDFPEPTAALQDLALAKEIEGANRLEINNSDSVWFFIVSSCDVQF
jgi:hypothetical protein